MKKAQERVEKEKKKANKARRIRTVNSGIFEDEDLELQLARLERETVRKSEESGRRKMKKVRKRKPSEQFLFMEGGLLNQ